MSLMPKLDDKSVIRSLQLFASLIKSGCEWHGDVLSKKWAECLYFGPATRHDLVEFTLTQSGYVEGVDFKRDGNSVWIA